MVASTRDGSRTHGSVMSRGGVLIVDDDPVVRSFLSVTLESIATVEEAADADRALAVLEARAGSIDLMLVDQVLPQRSGLELLRITRRNWPWIAVAILTGFGSKDLAVQALRDGASDYLKKPITVMALQQAVARLMAAARAPMPFPDSRAAGGGAETGRGRVHPNIAGALRFMSEHFTDVITLADVAREAGFSRFHFCRRFHDEVGVPFHVHLDDLRVRRAKVLLAEPLLRISEVASAVGFNGLSHFDRTFRKKVGQSPSAYRASLLRCA